MALFRVNLDEQLEEHLNNAALYQRNDRSEIVRQALTEYFSSAQNHIHDDEAIWDEWRDFSRTVLDAQQEAVMAAIRTLPDVLYVANRLTNRVCSWRDAEYGTPVDGNSKTLAASVRLVRSAP